MLINELAQLFLAQAPFSVLTRATFEHTFSDQIIDEVFVRSAVGQYQQELLFSSVVDIMGAVVLRGSRSVNAAFLERRRTKPLPVSITSLYNKLNATEPQTAAALVRETVKRLSPLVDGMRARKPSLVPERRVKVIDGNHFAATEHRMEVLRTVKDAPLPGQVVAVLDPALDLAIDVIPCEDGHAQERSLTDAILALAEPYDCFIADRNFCTMRLLLGLLGRNASFIIRQHMGNLRWTLLGDRCEKGRIATGTVFEQPIRLEPEEGRVVILRRITLVLDKPTKDGETEIHLLTDLPETLVTAERVAEVYRERWQVEGLFHDLTVALRCEVKTLGYPRAAILAFCVALSAYNLLSIIRAAVRATQGPQAEEDLSEYYMTDEIAGNTPGMMIALPAPSWSAFRTCSTAEMTTFLLEAARRIDLRSYKKHRRGPKKPPPPRKSISKTSNHVSTQRLLEGRRKRT